MDNDFDNVTWATETDEQPEPTTPEPRSSTSRDGRQTNAPPPARPAADEVDLSGIGSGELICTVSSPLKEGEGTKDAYVSYLITTEVGPQNRALRYLRLTHR